MTEKKKYLLRFGAVILTVVPILFFAGGSESVKILAHKVCMVMAAIGLAEFVWVTFFKYTTRRVEDLKAYDKRTIMVFRGLLYAAIVLGLSLGL